MIVPNFYRVARTEQDRVFQDTVVQQVLLLVPTSQVVEKRLLDSTVFDFKCPIGITFDTASVRSFLQQQHLVHVKVQFLQQRLTLQFRHGRQSVHSISHSLLATGLVVCALVGLIFWPF